MKTAVRFLITAMLASPVILTFNACSSSQITRSAYVDAALQQKLESAVQGFKGNVGVYVRNLKTGQMAAVNQDTLFPTASMIKVSILCGIFDKIEKGELKYNQELLYRDSLKYDDGVTGSFRDST
ncbi:MAG TPA: serine hydrolase, partial [Bacteroidota bacterium]|nr:serine hydrolase [Bacteroidota bacterium]